MEEGSIGSQVLFELTFFHTWGSVFPSQRRALQLLAGCGELENTGKRGSSIWMSVPFMGLSSASHKCWCPSRFCPQSSSHSLVELMSSAINLSTHSSHPSSIHSTPSVHLHKYVLLVSETQHVQTVLVKSSSRAQRKQFKVWGSTDLGLNLSPIL